MYAVIEDSGTQIKVAEGDVIDIDSPIDLIVADAILRERSKDDLPEGIVQ